MTKQNGLQSLDESTEIMIIRRDKETKKLIAFFPLDNTNYGRIGCDDNTFSYGEASIDYYNTCQYVRDYEIDEVKKIVSELQTRYSIKQVILYKRLTRQLYDNLVTNWRKPYQVIK